MDSQILPILSFLGVFQGMYLSLAFFVRRKQTRCHNRWLAALFALLSVIMLLISLSNSELIPIRPLLEGLEFSLTFAAGPALYLFSCRLLNRPFPKRHIVLLHFSPFLLYTGYQMLFFSSISPIEISIILPLVHLQSYTLWLVAALIEKKVFKNWRSGDSSMEWLVLIAALLLFLHAAQWIRYFFAEIQWLEFIVPVTALAGIQALLFYGLSKSKLFSLAVNSNAAVTSKPHLESVGEKLTRLIEEEKLYSDPDLTLEKFAMKAGLHAHTVSQIINDRLGMGFNNFVNRHRIRAVKKLLVDSQHTHLTIEGLANEAGFKSRSSFYSAFRKFTGTTPTAFKEKKKMLS